MSEAVEPLPAETGPVRIDVTPLLRIVVPVANDAQVALMDEPFGALDAMTRERLQEELLTIWRATGLSVVFVTRSLEEAIYLADRVVVMSPGPGRIVAEERITLERPRDVSSPEFNDIRRRLATLLLADHAREAA